MKGRKYDSDIVAFFFFFPLFSSVLLQRVTIDRIRSTGSHREDAVPLRARMRHDAAETRAWDA